MADPRNFEISDDEPLNINMVSQSNPFNYSNANHQPAHGQAGERPKLEKAIPEILFECDDGEPLQLIRVLENGQFELIEETAQKILEVNGNVGFCCLAGKYRTGKSFLLNRLLNLKGSGFKVSKYVNACTEGIWVWSKPILNERENLHIFFLDTEGLDSTDSNSNRDSKLFALAVIMSSYFMFNLTGVIDENAINQLSLITHIVKNIVIDADHPNNEYSLSYYSPKFLLILRDFMLETRDVKGRLVNPTQYLESSLTEIMNVRNFTDKQRQIRESILTFFKFRDCVTMVRPADSENHLQNLNESPDNVRPEFTREVNRIRDKIYNNCGAKQLQGMNMTARMYIKMVQSFVESINNGAAPNIMDAWSNILENECMLGYQRARATHDTLVDQEFRGDSNTSLTFEGLQITLNRLRDQSFDIFSEVVGVRDKDEDMYISYYNLLTKYIEEREATITQLNSDIASEECATFLREKGKDINTLLGKGHYDHTNYGELLQKFDQMVDGYDQNNNGPEKCKILLASMKTMQTNMLNSLKNSIGSALQKMKSDTAKNTALVEATQDGLEKELTHHERLKELQAKDLQAELKKVAEKERILKTKVQQGSQLEDANEGLGKKLADLKVVQKNNAEELANMEIKKSGLEKQKKGACCG